MDDWIHLVGGESIDQVFNPFLAKLWTSSGHGFQIGSGLPSITRGYIARAALYMALLYNMKLFKKHEIESLKSWTLIDAPSKWEEEYASWIQSQPALKNIRNPFIKSPHLVTLSGLFDAITEDSKSSIQILAFRPSSRQLLLYNSSDISIELTSSYTLRIYTLDESKVVCK